jgi:hypothetical protein
MVKLLNSSPNRIEPKKEVIREDYGISVDNGLEVTLSDPKTEGLDEHIVTDNSIGILQELCVKHSYTAPDYKFTDRTGMDHNPVFTSECHMTVNGRQLVTEGKGSTKKLAKNMSAQEMVALLRKPSSNGTKQHSLSAPSNQLLTYFLSIGSDQNIILICEQLLIATLIDT